MDLSSLETFLLHKKNSGASQEEILKDTLTFLQIHQNSGNIQTTVNTTSNTINTINTTNTTTTDTIPPPVVVTATPVSAVPVTNVVTATALTVTATTTATAVTASVSPRQTPNTVSTIKVSSPYDQQDTGNSDKQESGSSISPQPSQEDEKGMREFIWSSNPSSSSGSTSSISPSSSPHINATSNVEQEAIVSSIKQKMESRGGYRYTLRADSGGFAVIHYAAAQGHTKVLDMIVDQIRAEAQQKTLDEIAESQDSESQDDGEDNSNGGDGGNNASALLASQPIIKKDQQTMLQQAINTRDAKGNTALHWALKQNQNDVVTMLVALGADLSIANDKGELPIHCAVETCANLAQDSSRGSKGQHALAFHSLQVLISNEADVNTPNLVTGETPVSLASVNEDLATLSYLVTHGADVNCQDANGYTPLMYAVQMGNEDTLIGLMRAGAAKSVNSKDNLKGWSALHWAAATDSPLSTHALISSGADVNTVNANGETPLMLSARGSKKFQVPMVTYLLDNGADPTIEDVQGRTVLDRITVSPNSEQLKAKLQQWMEENQGLSTTTSLTSNSLSEVQESESSSADDEQQEQQTTSTPKKTAKKPKTTTKKQLVAG